MYLRQLIEFIRALHSRDLLVAILVLQVVLIFSGETRHAGFQSDTHAALIGWTATLINLAIGMRGLWTTHRVAWAFYLAVSVVAFIMVGAATPLSLLVIAWRLVRPLGIEGAISFTPG